MLKYLITPLSLAFGLGLALAGGSHSADTFGISVFVVLVVCAFAINWLSFIPSFWFQTEKFYDLTGSVTFLSMMGLTLYWRWAFFTEPTESNSLPVPLLILAGMVCLWSLRLGIFLFNRIHKAGKDGRFDDIKPSFVRFLNAWSLQGLWVVVSIGPVVAAISSVNNGEFSGMFWFGVLLWAVGLSIEIIADHQKSRFKSNPEHTDQFIASGLWSWVRHPNYLGEIMLWTGIAVASTPFLTGWQYLTLISPLCIAVLLTKVSGIPLLEERGKVKWGHLPAYHDYLAQTPRIIPWLSKWRSTS